MRSRTLWVGLTLCVVVANMGATWTLVNPAQGSSHPKNVAISGGGMTTAPFGTAFIAEVWVNGKKENTTNGSSVNLSWGVTIPLPPSGQWTVSQTAAFKLFPSDGSQDKSHTIIITN
ncbi:MAG: hypothetical protein FJ297_06325 [Planctomycetes bacterium]|nr:hypothetical protein [Planctomycetota bacterium]